MYQLLGSVLLATAILVMAPGSYAGHHENAEQSATPAAPATPDSSMSDAAKRAGAKGASTGADSLMGGATVEDSAKQGGEAAVNELMNPSTTSDSEATAPVSAAPEEATD